MLEGSLETWLETLPALEAEDRMRDALAAARREGAETARAPVGPHRSDLRVMHVEKGKPADLCSTGEQKSPVNRHRARRCAAARGGTQGNAIASAGRSGSTSRCRTTDSALPCDLRSRRPGLADRNRPSDIRRDAKRCAIPRRSRGTGVSANVRTHKDDDHERANRRQPDGRSLRS